MKHSPVDHSPALSEHRARFLVNCLSNGVREMVRGEVRGMKEETGEKRETLLAKNCAAGLAETGEVEVWTRGK